MAAAVTRGVQAHKGCGVTLKHFCANNQEDNRYKNNSLVSERALREIYIRSFEISIRTEQPKAVLNAIKKGTLSRQQVRSNVSYLIRTAKELGGYLSD